MTSSRLAGWAALAALIVLAGGACLRFTRTAPPRWSPDLAALRVGGDGGVTDTVARGVLHRKFVDRRGPWAIDVLDVDRAFCWTAAAIKGHTGAVGRTTTSLLAAALGRSMPVAGAVNADFFLFDPPGLPTGAHVSNGRLVAGPAARPVFAVDSAGRPWAGPLSVTGVAVSALDSMPIASWNRIAPAGLAWFDAGYGPSVDTLTGAVRVVLAAGSGQVQTVDTGSAATRIPSSGGVLVLGPGAAAPVRERFLLSARARGRFTVQVRLSPFHPREAVGGFPVLVRDSQEVAGLDSAGAATFAPVRHPRTLVAWSAGGRRLMLVTIDGRQPGHSVGATLRESARLALELGATGAINLDGGGSTTMVVRRDAAGVARYVVVNRPSDAQGERPVGNALGVVRQRAGGWGGC